MKVQGNWLFKYHGTLPVIILVVSLFVYLKELSSGAFPDNHLLVDVLLILVSVVGLFFSIYVVVKTMTKMKLI
jgi:hypothetical protein